MSQGFWVLRLLERRGTQIIGQSVSWSFISAFVRDCNLYERLAFDISVTAVGHLAACRQFTVETQTASSHIAQVQCPASKLHPYVVLLSPCDFLQFCSRSSSAKSSVFVAHLRLLLLYIMLGGIWAVNQMSGTIYRTSPRFFRFCG